MKTKDFSLQVKSVDETGTFEGYASTFGNVDSQGEKVMPGAFAESLAKHRREGTMPLLLWNHNPSEPIGGWSEMAEDGKGLWGKGRILVNAGDTERRIHSHLMAGNLKGMSIGYREMDVKPNGNVRELIKLDLVEASIVSFPANRSARVDAVKNDSWGKLEVLARALRDGEPLPCKEFEDILRDAGVPKALATQIASVGYAKAIRSESEGKAIDLSALRNAVSAFNLK